METQSKSDMLQNNLPMLPLPVSSGDLRAALIETLLDNLPLWSGLRLLSGPPELSLVSSLSLPAPAYYGLLIQ